ncbi:VanZ family protein [Lutibacter sp.]
MERKVYFLVAISFTIAITIGSLISVKNVIELPPVKFFDKFLHTSAYFLLTLSWLFTYIKSRRIKNKGILIAIIIFIYGIIIEILQGVLTIYRQADYFDILANFTGIVIAWVFFSIIFKKK